MARPAVLVTVMCLAGCASINEQHALRIDGTSEAAFVASMAAFQQQLPPQRRALFEIALQDIWRTTKAQTGSASSEADTAKIYFAQLNGLGYDEIIRLADATPPTTRQQYNALLSARLAANGQARRPPSVLVTPMFSDPGPSMGTDYNPVFNVYPNGVVPGH